MEKNSLRDLRFRWIENGKILDPNCINILETAVAWLNDREEAIACGEIFSRKLDLLPHYEDFVRGDPDGADSILENSDPEAIFRFNELIDEFNNRRDEIISLGRKEAEKYLERAMQIIDKK